jgi:hypothetical protein
MSKSFKSILQIEFFYFVRWFRIRKEKNPEKKGVHPINTLEGNGV